MKFVIACDSFKGCLASAEVGKSVAAGIRDVLPDADIVVVPVGDGGEGTMESLAGTLGADIVSCDTVDARIRPICARYAIFETVGKPTAIIDVASSCGLTLIPPEQRRIMEQSSYGVGMMISDALRRDCRHIYIGLGGSATCDGGIGLFAALGFRFSDKSGRALPPVASSLSLIASIDESAVPPNYHACRFSAIADVSAPLCGPEGAARIFAPQKGASEAEVELLEKGLQSFASVLKDKSGLDVIGMPSAGAAGGIGAGLMALAHADVHSGVDAVLDIIDFDRLLADAALVITGEGRMDRQTLMGKLPMGVCRRAMKQGLPTIALTGAAEDTDKLLKAGFAGIFPIGNRPMPLEEAMNPEVASKNLKSAASSIAKLATTLKS